MDKKEIQATVQSSVLEWSYKCFWRCGGKQIPVTKDANGVYRTAGNIIIEEDKVTCIGTAIDKVARAQKTADDAKVIGKNARATANTAQATANSAKATSKNAQATADEAIKRLDAMAYNQEACLDSMRELCNQLTITIDEKYTTLNNSYVTLNGRFDGLERKIPPDQSGAIALLQSQISNLEDNDKIFKAFALKKSKNTYQKIELKAAELKALEAEKAFEDPEDADPPSPAPKPHRKWWQRR